MKRFSLVIAALLMVFGNFLFAQNIRVSGTVNELGTGAPLPFVSIQVKGTTAGTTTMDNGSFVINAPANGTLVFSFIGYKTIEVPIENRSVVNVQLALDAVSLEEVVMVAYGTAKRSSVTGSITSVGAASIEKRPVTNALAALSGAAPGVQVNTSYGQPGADPTIRIRGFGSINYSSDPLIVLDGAPYNGVMANINPSDIESINILKDAASTALFGSRGSNGVVMITTKKGRKEKLSISATVTQGFSGRGLPEYDRIDAFQYYPVMWESLRNQLITPTRTSADASILASGTTSNGIIAQLGYNPFKGIADGSIVGTDGKLNSAATSLLWSDTDWYTPVEQLGNRTEATVSASGGSDNADYYLSVGYTTDHGWIKKTNYDRISARANVNFTPKKWITFGVNLNTSYNTSTSANTESNTGYANPIYFARTMGPIYPVYQHNRLTGDYILDDQGNKLWDLGAQVVQDGVTYRARTQNNGRHGIAEHMLNDRMFERNTIQSRSFAEFTFLKDFKFKVTHSFDINNYLFARYENKLVGDGSPQGRSEREQSLRYTWTTVQMLTYNKTFGKHDINVMAAHENYKNQFKYLRGFRQGEIIPGNTELINFTTTNSLSSYVDNHSVEGYLARASYSYDNGRYTLEGSYRRDGSSKFENAARWGDFWSVGVGWRIDKEGFMAGLTFIDFLKLRASHGLNGNDGGISYFAWQVLYNYNNNAAEPGFIQSTLPGNPLLKWETSVQTDIGLDFNLFNNRLRGTVDWFNKESKDLIFSLPLAPSTGYVSQDRNVGSVYNRGWEMDLTAGIVDTKNFSISLNLNATTYKNVIKRLPEANRELGIISGNFKRVEGGSIYDYWLRQWYGVDPTNGNALYLFNDAKDALGNYITVWADTDCKTLADGTLVTSSQAKAKYDWAGSSIPDLFGSITPMFKIYGVDLSFQFNYSIGGMAYDYNWASLMSSGGMGTAKAVEILDRWTTPGQITNVPRMDNAQTTNFNAASSRWLVSSTYLALRNINVSYNFKPNVLKSLDLKALKIYASAENLAIFSSRKGLDPTQNFSGSILNDVGFNRVITFGVNVNF
ncbi:MAG: SusC/RagA family TonB-linked outer membrane protein [Bacteroidales bacterium]|nr:SusC/RagA family TonB-linked outer membrane protein [Bacteroidales bacterium]